MPGNNNLVLTVCRQTIYILNVSTGKFTGATCSLIQVNQKQSHSAFCDPKPMAVFCCKLSFQLFKNLQE